MTLDTTKLPTSFSSRAVSRCLPVLLVAYHSTRSSIINTNIEVNPCQLAYFYCLSSPAEPERGNPVEIMRALLRQLTSTDGDLPLPKPVADVYDARKKMASRDGSEPMELDLEDCAGLILELTKETPAMIIVDALDECVDPYYMLARTLVKIASKSEKRAKIFVSSRYDSNLVSAFPLS